MQTKHLFLLTAIAFLACAGLQAQVRIGDNTPPTTGALLDLNSAAKGGLVLSNISIADLSKIPVGTNLFPGITTGNDDTNTDFTGAMVYHTGENDISAGIYIWNGGRWVSPGGDDPRILYDAEMNDYTTGDFGTAGTWMTQNLRTTIGLIANLDYNYPTEGNEVTPTTDKFNANEEYGLFYTWTAATKGRTPPDPDTNEANTVFNPPIQGICPDEWHLPSNKEWDELEEEIANANSGADANTYGEGQTQAWNSGWAIGTISRGSHGKIMKSETKVVGSAINPQGTSYSHKKGGFDALLVGFGFVGYAYGYGQFANFWSSSSNTTTAWTRHLEYSVATVYRACYGKSTMFSIRCKKNSQL